MNLVARQFDDFDPHSRQASKSGFTTTRSETLFTGAADDSYDFLDDEEKHRHDHRRAPLWIHYQGFANWLKKQSFIKFKKRKDVKKYRQIWEHMLGIKLIRAWTKREVTHRNLIGPFPSSLPFIDIQKIGSRDIVKASLLRLSIVQNRIFKFDVDIEKKTHRSRRSVDLEQDTAEQAGVSANELISGQSLFNRALNKDVLRIVATILFDKALANNVLEELIQNPRFSMCGHYGKAIADTIAKEMNLKGGQDSQPSPTNQVSQVSPSPQSSTPVQQFSIRSTSPPKAKPKTKGSLYSPEFASPSPQWAAPKFQETQSPSLSPKMVVPKHKGHSDSVVYHAEELVSHTKNFSEIGYGDDEQESVSDDDGQGGGGFNG